MDYSTITDTASQSSAVFYGLLGAASAMILSSIGAAYGSAKPNIFRHPSACTKKQGQDECELNLVGEESNFKYQSKSKLALAIPFIPIIIAGVLAIYGLIYSVIVLASVSAPDYSLSRGYAHLAGGLALGFSCLASGIAVGIVGKNGLIAIAQNQSSPIKLFLNLVYCEALGLYGLIFGLIAASTF